jgi:hypothetical protein
MIFDATLVIQNSVCIKTWCPARSIIVHKNKLLQENTYRYTADLDCKDKKIPQKL